VDIEQISDAAKQGLFALLANAPMMATQGMDPLKPLLQAAQIAKERENGKPFLDALAEAFQPTPEEQAAAQQQNPLAALVAGGGAPPGGEQVPGDNSFMGAGAAPDVSMILAGLTQGGNPNLQANVSRRLPA
jgi:hypothetical protein